MTPREISTIIKKQYDDQQQILEKRGLSQKDFDRAEARKQELRDQGFKVL